MTATVRTVGILHSSYLLEDWLDPLGVSIDEFHTDMVGSWLFSYAGALAGIGVRVVLLSVSSKVQTAVRRVHTATGAPHWILPAPRMYRSASRMPGLRTVSGYMSTPARLLRDVLREESCDALLVQDYQHQRFDVAILLGKALRIPVYASFQGCRESRFRPVRHLRGMFLRAAAGIIAPTFQESTLLHERYGVAADRITRIFNPVDTDFWKAENRLAARILLGLPPDATIVGWHGRVDFQYKGLDVLLDAWGRISRNHISSTPLLLLVGMGADAEELQRRIDALPAGSVHWIDRWVHDRTALRTYLSAADVFAFPSRTEGFPVAPMEAMACGLPIVATDASGVWDILEGGEAAGGLIVPRGDVDAFAAALCAVMVDTTRAATLGARAKSRAESAFSPDVVGRQLDRFFFGGPTACSQ
jgi:glycosyltransferase involved in cell wall biosynthesis